MTSSSPKGVFVALSSCCSGRIKLKELSSGAVIPSEVATKFPVGTAFSDLVVVEALGRGTARRIELSLKQATEQSAEITAEDLSVSLGHGLLFSSLLTAIECSGVCSETMMMLSSFCCAHKRWAVSSFLAVSSIGCRWATALWRS